LLSKQHAKCGNVGLNAAQAFAWPDLQISVRDQRRNREAFKHATRNAARDGFSELRMAIAAHYDQIGVLVGGQRQNGIEDISSVCSNPMNVRGQVVSGEMGLESF
jgi:hypothetical protein